MSESCPDEHALLHELNHRINNEFASAIGAVSLAAARSSSDLVKVALTGVAELHVFAHGIWADGSSFSKLIPAFRQRGTKRSLPSTASTHSQATLSQ